MFNLRNNFFNILKQKRNIIPSFNLEKLKNFFKPLVMRILTVKYIF